MTLHKMKGGSMAINIGVADVKKSFSTVISEVSLKGEHFVIEKKGKPMAALVSVQELQQIEGSKKMKKNGLLAAIGAWEDFENLEPTVSAIYEGRKKSKDRSAGGLV
jgi:antitoxin (DNA-binding transcriptional repressor) of toxin-antitoxin stability system